MWVPATSLEVVALLVPGYCVGQAENMGRAVVLVVEDEPLIRMMMIDLLEDAGFDAVEASNATQAVAILENRFDIRVVFTDVDMPGGMDGVKLAAAIRDRWPPIEIIVASGKRLLRQSDLPERSLFFPKPYDVDKVMTAITTKAGFTA